VSALLLAISLVLVVGLAKALSPTIESALQSLGAPKAVVGIAIAALVLLPESIAALRSALSNRLQTSLNLALGSALASIGLTIPAVALVSVWFHIPISLGVNSVGLVLLVLTMLVGILTLATGRATLLQGVVHLLIFFAYLFLTLVP
jgi:Ca2+:H+ antiporter